jgi:hypothetical protein
MWVNGKILTTYSKKIEKWQSPPEKEKILWGLCPCGEVIHEGDSVGMYGEHTRVVCYVCWMSGRFPDFHVDCVGLKFPDATLAQ